MKPFLPFLLFVLLGLKVSAQFGLPPGFDIKAFQQLEKQALWMLQYDSAISRVRAFDPLVADLTLLCIPAKSNSWKVFAGTLDSTGLHKQVCYTVNEKRSVAKQAKPGDTTQCDAFARALWQAKQHLNKGAVPETYHTFVYSNPDQTITVTAFIAIDNAQLLSYGTEYSWWYATDGRKLVTSKITKQSYFHGALLNNLPVYYLEGKMPTLGIIYAAHRFRFKEVRVEYKTGISTFYFNAAENVTSWEHVAREKKKGK